MLAVTDGTIFMELRLRFPTRLQESDLLHGTGRCEVCCPEPPSW